MRATSLTGLAIAISLFLTSCSNSNFASGQKTSETPQSSDAVTGPTVEPIAAGNGSWMENFVVEANSSNTADIVFAVDTSGSMEDEIAAIENNIAAFVKSLETNNLDFSIAAIGNGEDFNFPQDPRINVIPEEIGSHDAIGVLNSFLQSPNSVRADSHLNIIIVTDDNGEGNGNLANDFQSPQGIASLKVHAVVGLAEGEDPNNPDCDIPAIGVEHQNLAKASKGLIQNICLNDWSQLIANLSNSVIESTRRAFPLTNGADPNYPLP